MRVENVGKKKILQLCTYFRNDSLPLVGTFNSERVMLLSLLLLLLHPPPSCIAFILLCVTSAPCAAEQHFGFYGSCCSQWTCGPAREMRKKKPKVAGFGCATAVGPRPVGWDVFREGAPRVGRSHGQQLLGHPGPGACAFSPSMKWLKDDSHHRIRES